MKVCLYCGLEKEETEFSDEHIWPDALGGDYLPREPWRTDDVCQACNSLCGLFVDGSFIRSWPGQADLSRGALEYLAGKNAPAAIPLDYLGPIRNVPLPQDHVADYWAGPCGANIVHIRPDDGDEQWSSYAGGSPKAKKAKAGRAYMALTSTDPFWIAVSLLSFRRHFDRAERFIVNMELPDGWPFKGPDRTDPIQAEDMKTVDAVVRSGDTGEWLHVSPAIDFHLGHRMLAKLGLALGYKLLGSAFLETADARDLRRSMREANAEKRKTIPVRGSGPLNGSVLSGAENELAWPGGWVLLVSVVSGNLGLLVVSPSGQSMSVMISDDPALVGKLPAEYSEGMVWLTVPAAEQAVGPLSLASYLGHVMYAQPWPALTDLAAKRRDRTTLPPCGSPAQEDKEEPLE